PVVGVVDPTGAGDAFLGAFAVSLIEVKNPVIAASIAVAAGAYSVTVAGAQPSFPTQDDIADLLKR
ncbi:MAG: PfkB family carbohydrate kinase, partial [Actinomycetota bacterium]|nr:PfkB family carbohydrate kinase [Actinomycetota bacterium]